MNLPSLLLSVRCNGNSYCVIAPYMAIHELTGGRERDIVSGAS